MKENQVRSKAISKATHWAYKKGASVKFGKNGSIYIGFMMRGEMDVLAEMKPPVYELEVGRKRVKKIDLTKDVVFEGEDLEEGKIENPILESMLGGMAAGAAAGYVGARMARMKDENEELKKGIRNPAALGYKSAVIDPSGGYVFKPAWKNLDHNDVARKLKLGFNVKDLYKNGYVRLLDGNNLIAYSWHGGKNEVGEVLNRVYYDLRKRQDYRKVGVEIIAGGSPVVHSVGDADMVLREIKEAMGKIGNPEEGNYFKKYIAIGFSQGGNFEVRGANTMIEAEGLAKKMVGEGMKRVAVTDMKELANKGRGMQVHKVFNPQGFKGDVTLELIARGGKKNETKRYEYKFASVEAAVRKMVDFVDRTGRLWDVEGVIREHGEVMVEGEYFMGEWNVKEGEFWFDRVNKKLRNSGSRGMDGTVKMAEKFHGRKAVDFLEMDEEEDEDLDLAVLGILTDIEVMTKNGKGVVEVNFADDLEGKMYLGLDEGMRKYVRVCTNEEGNQLYFVGGKQDISGLLPQLKKDGCLVQDKTRKVLVGEIYSVSYMADKHHLQGPESQKDGGFYIHKLGEESGIRPMLVFDRVNGKMEVVGGNYDVHDVGIKD